MVNVTRRVVSWLCLLRVRLGFVLGKESFGSGRLWHAAVIWMGPPSSVAGNFICTAVILRGEAFQRLGQEVRALMNGSMLHGSGEVTFAGGCSKWKDAQPDLCTFFSSPVFPLTLFLSLPFTTDVVTRRLSPDVSSSVLESSSPTELWEINLLFINS